MVEKSPITLGERIRELRTEADLSLRELSAKLKGASAAFLSDIELGRRYPSEKTLEQLARVLGTTLEDLQSFDTRPPVDTMKRRAFQNPAIGMAFRKLAELSEADLLRIAKEIEEKEKGKRK